MYVITQDDVVLLGPIDWNPRLMRYIIEEDTGFDFDLMNVKFEDLPLDLGNGIKIRKAVEDRPQINNKIQTYDGPFWTFDDNVGKHSYVPVFKSIDVIKNELKDNAANLRWLKEISGFTFKLKGVDVFLETSREKRIIFINHVNSLNDAGLISWKFNNGWMDVSKLDLLECVNAINAYVKAAFDWEKSISEAINNCSTVEELDALVLVVEEQSYAR